MILLLAIASEYDIILVKRIFIMANTTAVYARINSDLKNSAEEILEKLGITPSAAIQMLYSQIILTNGLPFQPVIPDHKTEMMVNGKKEELLIETNRNLSASQVGRASDSISNDPGSILETVKDDVIREIPAMMGNDCRRIILYGSYARGDYREDSDIDIAVLTESNRIKNRKYDDRIVDIAVDIGLKTSSLVNFILLPYKEYIEKKTWYPFFRNIDNEGILLYEC